jgi:hypothetical protein
VPRRKRSQPRWRNRDRRSQQPSSALVAEQPRFRGGGRQASTRVPVRNFAGLIQILRSKRDLTKVYWFGHGADGELQFGNGQRLTTSGILSTANADVSANFSPGGEIVFVACNAGRKDEFFQQLANAMRVSVRGFPSGVEWVLSFVGPAPARSITKRGLATPKVISEGKLFKPRS